MKHQSERPTNDQKAPYISPKLQVYGTISELTHSGGAPQLDDAGASQNAFLPPDEVGIS